MRKGRDFSLSAMLIDVRSPCNLPPKVVGVLNFRTVPTMRCAKEKRYDICSVLKITVHIHTLISEAQSSTVVAARKIRDTTGQRQPFYQVFVTSKWSTQGYITIFPMTCVRAKPQR